MPGDFHYVDENGVLVTTYWGELSIVDILETVLRRGHDPRIHEAKANVIDLSSATWSDPTTRMVRDEIERLRPALGPPKARNTVFIAPGDFFYGLCRMYALVQAIFSGAHVDVVRSWNAASELLHIDLADAEAWSR